MEKLGYESLEFPYSLGAPLPSHPLCNQNHCDIKNKTIAEYIDQTTGLKILQELLPAYYSSLQNTSFYLHRDSVFIFKLQLLRLGSWYKRMDRHKKNR